MGGPMLTPLEDLRKADIELYEQGSSAIHHYSSTIPLAINMYWDIMGERRKEYNYIQESLKKEVNIIVPTGKIIEETVIAPIFFKDQHARKTQMFNNQNTEKMNRQEVMKSKVEKTLSNALEVLEEAVHHNSEVKDASKRLKEKWFNEKNPEFPIDDMDKRQEPNFIEKIYNLANDLSENTRAIQSNIEDISISI